MARDLIRRVTAKWDEDIQEYVPTGETFKIIQYIEWYLSDVHVAIKHQGNEAYTLQFMYQDMMWAIGDNGYSLALFSDVFDSYTAAEGSEAEYVLSEWCEREFTFPLACDRGEQVGWALLGIFGNLISQNMINAFKQYYGRVTTYCICCRAILRKNSECGESWWETDGGAATCPDATGREWFFHVTSTTDRPDLLKRHTV